MNNIRAGNDFIYVWSIERMGEPENLNLATEIALNLSSPYGSEDIPFEIIDNNKIRIEFTPLKLNQESNRVVLNNITTYTLTLFYVLSDPTVEDLNKVCTVDIDAFTIVPRSAQASDIDEIASTSDVGIGFKGDKGEGIKLIELISTIDGVSTYRITYDDDATFDYTVNDGEKGDAGSTPYIGVNGNWWVDGVDTGEAGNLWEEKATNEKYINITDIYWDDYGAGGELMISGENTFEEEDEVIITYNGATLEAVVTYVYDGSDTGVLIDDSSVGAAIEDAYPNVTIEAVIPSVIYTLEPKNKEGKLDMSYIKGLEGEFGDIDSELSSLSLRINAKKDKPKIILTINKLDIVWEDGWIKVLFSISGGGKSVLVDKFTAKTGNGLIELNPIVNYPSYETYNSAAFDGFLLKDADNLLSENGIDFESVVIEYSLSGGIYGANNTKKFNLGGNVVFEDNTASHSHSMVNAFNAVYPEFSGDRVETVYDSLAGNNILSSAFLPTYCAIRKADITSYPLTNGAYFRKNTITPNILNVSSHYGNTFERRNLTHSATEFLPNVIAIGAAPASGTPNADWTSFGFGLEFSEEGNNTGLNAAYPDATFPKIVAWGTLSVDRKKIINTHTSSFFTNIIGVESGGLISIGDISHITETRTIDTVISATELTVTEAFSSFVGTMYIYLPDAKIGTVWQADSNITKFVQSPVCAIVMAKFRKIKDLSGASWHICRIAARATASQAGAWDMYRGFGVIDVDAAVQWIDDNYKSKEYQDMIADQLEGLRGISPFLDYENLLPNSPVAKRHIDSTLSEKVDKETGKSLIADTEISRLASVTNQTLSGLGGEAVSNKTQTLTDSETDYPSGRAVADVIIPSEQVTAESLTVLNRRIEALETILANSQYSKIDVLDEFNIFGKTNLILFGVTSPSITPDFAGQFYINTTAGITYQSKGIVSSGDWKQTSN